MLAFMIILLLFKKCTFLNILKLNNIYFIIPLLNTINSHFINIKKNSTYLNIFISLLSINCFFV
jgi:hypothetical protein